MGQSHLYELLSEEQEPFALHSFIEERRRQLRRPASKALSTPLLPPTRSSAPLHQLHLQLKRHAPSASVSSHSCKSSKSTFMRLWDRCKTKSSPLSYLSYSKSPSSARKLPAAFLMETALKIQKEQQQQNQKKRRRRINPSKDFRRGFLFSIMKKLVGWKRRHLEIASGKEEVAGFEVSRVKGFLKPESTLGGKRRQGTIEKARQKPKDADSSVGKPHYRRRSVSDRGTSGDGRVSQGLISRRCNVLESCPQQDDDRPPSESSGGLVLGDKASVSSPSRQHQLGLSSSREPSPEREREPTPAPSRRQSPSTERQLFGGNGDDGRTKPPYYEDEKEQFSPVSVLDPRFDEEEHDEDRPGHHIPEQQEQLGDEEEGEEAVDVHGETVVDSFRQSLAAVQRTKQELLGRIRRFERLADLDPVELDGRFAEVEEQDAACDVPEELEQAGTKDMSDVGELIWVVVDVACPAGCAGEIPGDVKRLVVDLAEEEEEENSGDGQAGGVLTTAERVRSRLEAWKGVGVNTSYTTIDMMVGMDVRREGDAWRRWPEEVREVAVEVEAAMFGFLVYEIADDLGIRINNLI